MQPPPRAGARNVWLAGLLLLLVGGGCGRSPLLTLGRTFDGGNDGRAVQVSDGPQRADGSADLTPGPDPRDAGTLDQRRDGVVVDLGRDLTPDRLAVDLVAERLTPEPPRDGGVADGARDGAFDGSVPLDGDGGALDGSRPDQPLRDGPIADRIPIDGGGAPDSSMVDGGMVDGGQPGFDAGNVQCDLVRQDCPAGQRCEIETLPSGVLGLLCVADLGGAGAHGAACRTGPADCLLGSSCIQDIDRLGNPVGPMRCNDFCHVDSDCPAGSSCVQTTLISGGQRLPVSICWP